jgi:hypothetical protein
MRTDKLAGARVEKRFFFVSRICSRKGIPERAALSQYQCAMICKKMFLLSLVVSGWHGPEWFV